MKTYREFLNESFVNLKTPQERMKVADEVMDLVAHTYKDIGGMMGSQKENLVNTPGLWKLVRKDGKIVAGVLYRDTDHGRKIRLIFHDGTDQGKFWVKKIVNEDIQRDRAWGEVSGALEKVMMKMGAKPVSNKRAQSILGLPDGNIKKLHSDGYHYDREVHPGTVKTQVLVGRI